VLGVGLAATIAAFAAAGFTVATSVGTVIAAAAAAAGSVGAASTLQGHKLADDQTSFLDAQLARGGVLETPPVRKRVVSHLMHVDEGMAKRVATGLRLGTGIEPAATTVPARREIKPSPASV
jgi:hypothetical protein